MSWVGDVQLGDTIDIKFNTVQFSTGAPFTFASGAVEIYEQNSVTQITAAETLTIDFDSVTGLHNLRIVCTGANSFEVGKDYAAVVSVGTVDSVSAVGMVIANFSVEHRATVTDTNLILVDTEAAPTKVNLDANSLVTDALVTAAIVDTEAIIIDTEAILVDTEAFSGDILTDTEALLVDTEAVPATIATLLIDTEITVADGITIIVDTEANKVITDKFVFTTANKVDCNVDYVNDQIITGDGSGGDPFQGA